MFIFLRQVMMPVLNGISLYLYKSYLEQPQNVPQCMTHIRVQNQMMMK